MSNDAEIILTFGSFFIIGVCLIGIGFILAHYFWGGKK